LYFKNLEDFSADILDAELMDERLIAGDVPVIKLGFGAVRNWPVGLDPPHDREGNTGEHE
jgi:hypothetical protein